MSAKNYSYPESDWVIGTQHDDLPLSQAAVDRALERAILRFRASLENTEEAIYNFNEYIKECAPLLYDRVTYKQIEEKWRQI